MRLKLNKSAIRLNIEAVIVTKKWFTKTDTNLQNELLSMGEEFNGFLKDLGERPEIFGNVEVLKLVQIAQGKSIVSPVFEVRSLLTNEKYTREYSSWKYGKYTGYKGILLLEEHGELNRLIVMRKNKFATATTQYEAIGTFDVGFSNERFINLPLNVENSIKKILSVEEFKLKRYIDLGILSPDAGFTNEQVALFAGIIDSTNAENSLVASQKEKQISGNDIEIFSTDRLFELTVKSDDAYLLSIIARLSALNVFSFSVSNNSLNRGNH